MKLEPGTYTIIPNKVLESDIPLACMALWAIIKKQPFKTGVTLRHLVSVSKVSRRALLNYLTTLENKNLIKVNKVIVDGCNFNFYKAID